MRSLFLAAAMAASGAACARGPVAFHLAADGDDARPPAHAARAATPWRTLARLDSVALLPGDSVLLRRGDVFPGTLRATGSGTARRPIVYAAYGRGPAPVVSGTEPLRVWAAVQGRFFAADAPAPIAQLFRDGKPLPLARHPNRGYLPILSSLGDDGFRAAPLPEPAYPGARWDGTALHLKSERFSLDARILARYNADAGVFRPDRGPNYPLRPGWGFFLNGSLAAVDTAWEWAYDSSSRKAYLFVPAGDSAAGHVFEASIRETGFAAAGHGGLRIEGLRFSRPSGPGIKIDSATDITIRNCAVLYPGAEGLELAGSGFRIESDTVDGAIGSGMRLWGDSSAFVRNVIRGTGRPERLGRNGFGGKCCRGNGLEFYGDGNRAARNRIIASALNGIRFEGRRARVEENLIDSAALYMDDAAGIYTWAPKVSLPGSAGSVIRANVVLNTPGSPEGTGDSATSSAGIYVDDRVHDVAVEGNTVANAVVGIYLHNTRNVTVRRNTSFGNSEFQIYLKRDYLVPEDMAGNLIAGNRFYSPGGRRECGKENVHGIANQGPLARLGRNYAGPWGTDSLFASLREPPARRAFLLVHDGDSVRTLSAGRETGRGHAAPGTIRKPSAYEAVLIVDGNPIPFPE